LTTTTKKLPVSLSYGAFQTAAHEFLIPALDARIEGFEGLTSGRVFPYGAVSYLGKEITVGEVFARLVDSGRKIDSVDQTIKLLEAYFEKLHEYRIGNVLTVERCATAPCGFDLKKVANAPPQARKKLP